MNEYYRSILNDNIKKGILDAALASNIEHPLLIGKLREIVVNQLLEPMLNNGFSTGSGKVVDYEGRLSKEIDICIYSKNLHPPVFFSANDKLGIFPIESVLSCIEVKTEFSKRNIRDAYNNFFNLESNLVMTSGIHDKKGHPSPQIVVKPHYRLFIFKTAIKKYSPESFLKIYREIDPNWDSNPLISHVCIVGKGSFCFTHLGWIHIAYNQDSNIHEEVISFLATIVQDLPSTEESRGTPRIGYYLTDMSKADRIISGKLHVRPWKSGMTLFKLENI